MNFAIKQAKFDYIARMDADDIAERERISIQLKSLKDNKADIIGSNCILIDEEDNELGITNYPTDPKK